jgi:hypothetical protein
MAGTDSRRRTPSPPPSRHTTSARMPDSDSRTSSPATSSRVSCASCSPTARRSSTNCPARRPAVVRQHHERVLPDHPLHPGRARARVCGVEAAYRRRRRGAGIRRRVQAGRPDGGQAAWDHREQVRTRRRRQAHPAAHAGRRIPTGRDHVLPWHPDSGRLRRARACDRAVLSTGLPVAGNYFSTMYRHRIPPGQPGAGQPYPLFSHVTRLGSQKVTKKGNTWYVPTYALGRRESDRERQPARPEWRLLQGRALCGRRVQGRQCQGRLCGVRRREAGAARAATDKEIPF